MMKRSEQEGVAMVIESYLKCVQKQQMQQQQKRLIKIIQIYGKQSWHKRLIKLMFAIFKKLCVKKEAFSLLCKRLLKIWDYILESSFKKNQHAYQIAISEIILESYTFIFPLIFQYRFLDLILDFKLYRMLWANYITDTAFFALRTQISKNHGNFDLNKNFTQDNINKIKERFVQKGLSEEQMQRYMAVTQLQKKIEPSPSMQRRQQRQSSDDEDSDVLKKKIKPDQNLYNPQSNQYNHFPYGNNPYQKPYPAEQPNPYQARPSPPNIPPNFPNGPNMNMYPPNFPRPYQGPYPPNNMYQGPPHYPMQTGQPYFPQSKNQHYPPYNNEFNNPTDAYPNYPQNNFNNYNNPQLNYTNPPFNPQPNLPIPNIMQPPIQTNNFNNYPNQNATNVRQNIPKAQTPNDFIINSRQLKRQSPEFTPKMNKNFIDQQYLAPQFFDSASTSKTDFKTTPSQSLLDKLQREKYKILLSKLKKGLNQCRQCGMHFISKQNLDEHKRQHFLQAHKRFLSKQSESLGNNLGIQKQKQKSQHNFDMMCSVNDWIMDESLQGQGSGDYQVSIKRLPPNERAIPVFCCYFCNQDMQIIWCEQLQQWTLDKGIKLHEGDRGLCVGHIDCYECFRAEQASFNTTSSLSY